MSEDKKSKKTELLGELESIKTLLEGSEKNDAFEDAPLLTEAIDQTNGNLTAEKSESSPLGGYSHRIPLDADDDLETEAPLIDPKAYPRSGNKHEDIESLYADIYRSLRNDPESKNVSPVNTLAEAAEEEVDSSLVDLEFQNIPILDNIHDESEEQEPEHHVQEEGLIDETDIDSLSEALENEHDADQLETEELESELEDSDFENENEANADGNNNIGTPSLFQLEPELEAELDTDDTEVSASTTPEDETATLSETQHSLFPDNDEEAPKEEPTPLSNNAESDTALSNTVQADKPQPKNSNSEHSKPTTTSHEEFTQKAVELSKKTENPFLPKHIRDRLQSNRITPNIYNQISFEQSKEEVQDQEAGSHDVEKTALGHLFTDKTFAKKTIADTGFQPVITDNNEIDMNSLEHIVDELVKTHLPKIEVELRNKLMELLKTKSDDES